MNRHNTMQTAGAMAELFIRGCMNVGHGALRMCRWTGNRATDRWAMEGPTDAKSAR